MQSYNRYSYVENNPLKYTDPTGHFSVGFGGSNMMGGGIGLSQEFIGIILSGPGSTPTEGMSGNMASKESADMAAVANSDQSAVTAIIEKVQTFVKNYKLHEIQALVELKKKRNEIRFKFLTETLGDAGALLYVLSEMYVPDLMPTTVEGVVGTVGLVGVGKLLGTFGRAAKINARTFRYMTEGEIAAIKETGYLRGGISGETFFTNQEMSSAVKVQTRLSLKTTPTHRVEFKIINNPKITGPNQVLPDNGFPGKGTEYFSKEPIKVNIINIQPLNRGIK